MTSPLFSPAFKLVQSVPFSGPSVIEHAMSLDKETGLPVMTPEERVSYIIQAADWFETIAKEADRYDMMPVDAQTFVESNAYLGRRGVVYPGVMREIVRLNNTGKYIEAVLTGAIGTGKTTIALFTTAYQLYLLSCLKNPHKDFNLDPASEILFVFQSLNAKVAKQNDYDRFRAMLADSPYFNKFFPFDKTLESEMHFPKRIIVRPLSAKTTASIGSNLIGGIIDEINFMSIVENSKQAADGGTFDQANEIYNSISRRRESRFMFAGTLPGMLCLVSSRRYPGEFTDRKTEQALKEIAETGKTGIFVYDKRLWEVKPPGTYSEETFNLFLGDANRKPRILEDDEDVSLSDQHLVMKIPVDFRSKFDEDILSAIRDIAGSSTFALHPYIVNTEAVIKAFGSRQSVLSVPKTDFVSSRPVIYPNRIFKPNEPRLAHVDLGITGDSAGVAVGYVDGFVSVPRGDHTSEMMPKICFDLVLEVPPPRNGEVEFESIRRMFYKLREQGMNLKWITYDTFQSRDSLQLLRQKGFTTGPLSMDTDSTAYDVTKSAFYDGRIEAPTHDKAASEFVRLERDPKTGKIDHHPHWSKDCSDAMAGVVYGLTYRRELWVRHGISMRDIIATTAAKVAKKDEKSDIAAKAGMHRHVASLDIGTGQAGQRR